MLHVHSPLRIFALYSSLTVAFGCLTVWGGHRWKDDGSLDKVAKLTAFAEAALGCSMAQLAIAWCLKNPNVST